ncbi:MAG: kelch motif-containing protein, partial [Actinobacteria bacterium]|nr:kelch motif-containing protein [Actinomycetota bacterium]
PNTWKVTIKASRTPDIEHITATGMVSGLSATADLLEGIGGWLNRTADGTNPTPGRENAAVAYDEAHKVTVLFGGYYGNHHRTGTAANQFEPRCQPDRCPPTPAQVVGDTWTWDGTIWTRLCANGVSPEGNCDALGGDLPGPSAREGAAMAYDASAPGGQLVLFGGHDGNDYLADTWTFDAKAKTWTKHDVAGPSKRYVANMASDGTGAVLFAGTAGLAYGPAGPAEANGPGRLDDTWMWRSGAWTDVTPKPAAPLTAAPPTLRHDVFANNPGQKDKAIVVPLPPPAPGCPGVHCDPDKANPYPSPIAVSGYGPSDKVANLTLTLNKLSWPQGTVNAPGSAPDANGPSDAEIMLVAPGGKAVMVMGDACGTPDNPNPIPTKQPITLTFDDSAALPLPDNCQGFADGKAHTYKPTNNSRLYEGECTQFHTPDYFPPPAPAGTNSTSLSDFVGTDPNGTWSLYVVDDCPNTPNPQGEAGRIDGGWSIDITTTDAPVAPPAPVSSPPGRGRAAMAYHPPTGKVVLFGGTQELMTDANGVRGYATTNGVPFAPLGDTWTWDPKAMSWAQEGTGTHPGERRSAAMAYHPGTGQLVLFGGMSSLGGRLADPNTRPDCPKNNGCDSYTLPGFALWGSWLNDTWTWDGKAWALQPTPSRPPGQFLTGMAADAAGRLVAVAVSEPGQPNGSFGPATTWTWDSNVSLGLNPQAVPADGRSTSVATARVNDTHGKGITGLKV